MGIPLQGNNTYRPFSASLLKRPRTRTHSRIRLCTRWMTALNLRTLPPSWFPHNTSFTRARLLRQASSPRCPSTCRRMLPSRSSTRTTQHLRKLNTFEGAALTVTLLSHPHGGDRRSTQARLYATNVASMSVRTCAHVRSASMSCARATRLASTLMPRRWLAVQQVRRSKVRAL